MQTVMYKPNTLEEQRNVNLWEDILQQMEEPPCKHDPACVGEISHGVLGTSRECGLGQALTQNQVGTISGLDWTGLRHDRPRLVFRIK